MAKLLFYDQLPQDPAEDDETSITSDIHAQPVQELGKPSFLSGHINLIPTSASSQADASDQSANVAAPDTQAHQEPDALVWEEVATKYVSIRGQLLISLANMKVITSIYLNCRPELRDEWLAGTDQDNELEDALASGSQAARAYTDIYLASGVRSARYDQIL